MTETLIKNTLDLLERLNPTSIVDSQVVMNNFLKVTSQAQEVFFVWIKPNPTIGIVNVVGSRILPDSLIFPVPFEETVFSEDHPSKLTMLEKSIRKAVISELKEKSGSLSMIPIRNTHNENRIEAVVSFVRCPKFQSCVTDIETCLRYVSGNLLASFAVWVEQEKNIVTQKLLRNIDYIYLNLGDLRELLQKICYNACQFLAADTCLLFIPTADCKFLTAKVIAGLNLKNDTEVLQIPVTASIAGLVLNSGKIIIFEKASQHPLYNKAIEAFVGGPVTNMIVFPIRDSWGRVVGVVAAVNRTGFWTEDKNVAAALSTQFGITMMHNLVHKRMLQTQARLETYKEVLNYHQAIRDEEVQAVFSKDNFKHNLSDWKWVCREVSLDAMPRLVMHMYESLGFINTCRMRQSTLCRFILLVQKNYRPVAYHNWMHAFGVAHFAYSLIKTLDLMGNSLITELEAVALLTGLLCHDCDHRGTTNGFQSVSKNALATLYESEGSILERHHFSVTLRLLSFPGCNIFEEMDTVSYSRVLSLMRTVIIATDLGVHLNNINSQREVVENYDANNIEHRYKFLALLASICDMNDQAKGWRNSKEAAIALYTEFFAQGDMEKDMGLTPMVMMDREKADIPSLQVIFISDVCLPIYRMLVIVCPDIEDLVLTAIETIDCWKRTQIWFSQHALEARAGLTLLNDLSLEVFVNESWQYSWKEGRLTRSETSSVFSGRQR